MDSLLKGMFSKSAKYSLSGFRLSGKIWCYQEVRSEPKALEILKLRSERGADFAGLQLFFILHLNKPFQQFFIQKDSYKMGFIQDFKEFAFKGNLIDMAVGIIMGTAAAAIVKSFLDNIITPLIAMVAGVPDMTGMKYPVGTPTEKLDEKGDVMINAAGEKVMEQPAILYGTFLQNVIDFLILAFVIFIALKVAAKMMKAAADEAPPSDEVVLLTEIRDSLKK